MHFHKAECFETLRFDLICLRQHVPHCEHLHKLTKYEVCLSRLHLFSLERRRIEVNFVILCCRSVEILSITSLKIFSN